MRWILYLDLDDTILFHGAPVHNSAAFFQWCDKHFDVKWMTRWTPSGTMSVEQIRYLGQALGVAKDQFSRFNNPLEFKWCKTEAIAWEGPQPFIWVENKLFPHEEPRMIERMNHYFGNTDRFYETNLHYWDLTPKEPQAAHGPENAIWRTWNKIAKDFNLPMEIV